MYLNQITQLICFTFNKSAESDRPHDKVFHGTKTIQTHNHYMAGFPAPADILISDETSPLLFPASPPPQTLLHLGLTKKNPILLYYISFEGV